MLKRIAKKSFEDFKIVMAVHVHGTFLFTREVAAQHWHPLFKANGNQPLDDVLYQCRELVEDPDFPTVKRWRENGGKVVGHFQVYFPE